MSWHARLELHARRDGERTVVHSRHVGPLRLLRTLYPEGPGIAHCVLVHPPGGIVGGDVLEVNLHVATGAHVLVTTPGATRFYRSDGARAEQRVRLHVEPGARLEWLPLETIAYSGCEARNGVRLELAPGAEVMGWDVLALGLPAAAAPFEAGRFEQHIEWPGVWLERGVVAAADARLLRSPMGLGGRSAFGTLFAAGTAFGDDPRRERMLDSARAALAPVEPADEVQAGVTSAQSGVITTRALAPRIEPLLARLARVHAAWRAAAWGLAPHLPRVWRT